MPLERFVCDVIEERRKSPLARAFLRVLSLFVKGGTFLYHALYDKSILPTTFLPKQCLVVSVGNIVAGGTGKTPFVQMFVNALTSKSCDVAILSRGYRAAAAKSKSLILSKGEGPLWSISVSGDEPYFLAKTTKAAVLVGKDRVQSARIALDLGVRTLVLDDGFQHRRLHRDVDIVLLDATDLWGRGYFLPRGYLRDFPRRLAKAHFIGITRCELVQDLNLVEQEVRLYTQAPIAGFTSRYQIDQNLLNTKIGAFCGIAKPHIFYQALESLGAHIVCQITEGDHRLPAPAQLQSFAVHARELGAALLVCTEKDFVKLEDPCKFALPILPLKMEFACVWQEKSWKEMLHSLQNREHTK
ncbi:MAG: tetraacyldisaccharide 4'-kinase [Chlamydiae bacterium]|nr:tetraacyldisaccharide 4'-kinase [Chlamydiota bacterium]